MYQLERSENLAIPASGPGRLLVKQAQGLGIVLWSQARFVYALVADLSMEGLQRLAAHVDGV
jgi:hypothetical protein